MKKNILVVEDNKDLQRLYHRMLSDRYNLYQVRDTKEAWRIISQKPVDLAILDIILPKGNTGDQFYMQLTQDPEYQHIPVIFVSVIDDVEEARALENVNHAAYITKPFKEEQLLDKIEEMLGDG